MKCLINILCISFFLVISCKNKTPSTDTKTVENTQLSAAKKYEIVTYYLANYFNNPTPFEEIVFLNDTKNQVKVITNKNQNAFMTITFSNALRFYNKHHTTTTKKP